MAAMVPDAKFADVFAKPFCNAHTAMTSKATQLVCQEGLTPDRAPPRVAARLVHNNRYGCRPTGAPDTLAQEYMHVSHIMSVCCAEHENSLLLTNAPQAVEDHLLHALLQRRVKQVVECRVGRVGHYGRAQAPEQPRHALRAHD